MKLLLLGIFVVLFETVGAFFPLKQETSALLEADFGHFTFSGDETQTTLTPSVSVKSTSSALLSGILAPPGASSTARNPSLLEVLTSSSIRTTRTPNKKTRRLQRFRIRNMKNLSRPFQKQLSILLVTTVLILGFCILLSVLNRNSLCWRRKTEETVEEMVTQPPPSPFRHLQPHRIRNIVPRDVYGRRLQVIPERYEIEDVVIDF